MSGCEKLSGICPRPLLCSLYILPLGNLIISFTPIIIFNACFLCAQIHPLLFPSWFVQYARLKCFLTFLKSAFACFTFISNPKYSKLNLWSSFQVYFFYNSSNFNKFSLYPPRKFKVIFASLSSFSQNCTFISISTATIFIHYPCFSPELWLKLSESLHELLSNSILPSSFLSEGLLNTGVWSCHFPAQNPSKLSFAWGMYDCLLPITPTLGTSLSLALYAGFPAFPWTQHTLSLEDIQLHIVFSAHNSLPLHLITADFSSALSCKVILLSLRLSSCYPNYLPPQ